MCARLFPRLASDCSATLSCADSCWCWFSVPFVSPSCYPFRVCWLGLLLVFLPLCHSSPSLPPIMRAGVPVGFREVGWTQVGLDRTIAAGGLNPYDQCATALTLSGLFLCFCCFGSFIFDHIFFLSLPPSLFLPLLSTSLSFCLPRLVLIIT